MPKISSSYFLYAAAGLAVLALFGFIITREVAPALPSPYDGFTQCLTEKGVAMYGAWWCPHCQNQKDLFGTAFNYVNYVECSPGGTKTMSAECRAAGVEGYPTWILNDGTKLSGEQSFKALSEASGCSLPETPTE
jgi:hypothetical protein